MRVTSVARLGSSQGSIAKLKKGSPAFLVGDCVGRVPIEMPLNLIPIEIYLRVNYNNVLSKIL